MPAGKGRVGRGSHKEEHGEEGGHTGEGRAGEAGRPAASSRCQRREGKIQSSGGKVGTWGRDSGMF